VGKTYGVLIMGRSDINHVLAVYVPWAVGFCVLLVAVFSGYEQLFSLIF